MTETRQYPPIHLGSPGEDISKKDLHAICQRFKNLNQIRLQRIQAFLQPRQQIFLDLLPLLFHLNHPLLPGFISSETSAGIADYLPNKQAIHAAKQFSNGFTYKRKALLNYSIHGIFLMGSISSIAFSKTSDIDIWLCHEPGLLDSKIEELQQKASEIEKWATSFNLEIHFFLIDHEQFAIGKNTPISIESSGDTQHYLLLEEFYRTAVFIAGRIPAWWLVPPHQEHNHSSYISHLIENRFISENEILDFGGLESIPAEEFISATLWNIYKSINSPHKSLLKLFLMESYASEFPHPNWLCFELKIAIYQGTFDIERLDPYLLIYSKVEKYLLQTDSTQRLDLARKCFYLKIMGLSSKELDFNSRIIKEEYMQSIARQWNWPEDLLPALHRQKHWDIRKATQEHNTIRAELKQCLRMTINLASDYVNSNYRQNSDLKLISRKLHVFLEKRAEKIELMTTRSSVHYKENELSIVESDNKKSSYKWVLYAGKYDSRKPSANKLIKTGNTLLSLLGWLVINGLYQKKLQLYFNSDLLSLSKSELQHIINQLFSFVSNNLKAEGPSLAVYNKPDKLISSYMFINLGQTLANEREDSSMIILSERSNPLSYGNTRHCFIQQIDQISISIWGEVTLSQYRGLDGFFSYLTHFFNNSKTPVSKQSLKIACYTPTRANSIVLRAESVFSNLVKFFSPPLNSQNYRYFLSGERSTYAFQSKNNLLNFWPMESKEAIMLELSSNQDLFSAVHFEDEVLENSVIPTLYKLNKPHIIQIFYLSENTSIGIFIIDEKGALFTKEHYHCNYNQVLNNYSSFLESILNHSFSRDDIQIQFFKIQKKAKDSFSVQPAKWTVLSTYLDLSVRITIEDTSMQKTDTIYNIYCNDREFNTHQYGTSLFLEVSQYIQDQRESSDEYPIRITDIEAPCSYLGVESNDQIQIINFLNFKTKIEAKLNN